MKYCFGNLNFGGQLLDFMESFSELWNKALKK